ncbi:MAG: hypothetical protein WCV84_03255 [Patescibacteria group bacterium]
MVLNLRVVAARCTEDDLRNVLKRAQKLIKLRTRPTFWNLWRTIRGGHCWCWAKDRQDWIVNAVLSIIAALVLEAVHCGLHWLGVPWIGSSSWTMVGVWVLLLGSALPTLASKRIDECDHTKAMAKSCQDTKEKPLSALIDADIRRDEAHLRHVVATLQKRVEAFAKVNGFAPVSAPAAEPEGSPYRENATAPTTVDQDLALLRETLKACESRIGDCVAHAQMLASKAEAKLEALAIVQEDAADTQKQNTTMEQSIVQSLHEAGLHTGSETRPGLLRRLAHGLSDSTCLLTNPDTFATDIRSFRSRLYAELAGWPQPAVRTRVAEEVAEVAQQKPTSATQGTGTVESLERALAESRELRKELATRR